MTTTLTQGAQTVIPVQVLGYSATRQARNLTHNIIGQSAPAVTFKPAGLRTGTLKLLVLKLADALAAENLHTGTGICHLVDTDLPLLGMNYVATGSVVVELDEDTRSLWTVSIDFEEVG